MSVAMATCYYNATVATKKQSRSIVPITWLQCVSLGILTLLQYVRTITKAACTEEQDTLGGILGAFLGGVCSVRTFTPSEHLKQHLTLCY